MKELIFANYESFNQLSEIEFGFTNDPVRTNSYYENLMKWKIAKESFFSLIAHDEGRPIGFVEGSVFHLDNRSDLWNANLFTENLERYGKALAERLKISCIERGAKELLLESNDEVKKGFFEGLGAEHILESVESHFLLQEWKLPELLLPESYAVRSFAELKQKFGDDVYGKVIGIVKHVTRDIPGQKKQSEAMHEGWLRDGWKGTGFDPQTCLFLEFDGSYVGVHNITPRQEGEVFAGITGIHRDYRRKGLMSALKSEGMNRVAGLGYKRFVSNNEPCNPMLTLNLNLGFKIVSRSWTHRLKL